MKNLYIILTITILFIACGGGSSNGGSDIKALKVPNATINPVIIKQKA